jgi:hypothetical protein
VLLVCVAFLYTCAVLYNSHANILKRGLHLTVRHPDDPIPADVLVDDPVEPKDVELKGSSKKESSITTVKAVAIGGDKSNMHSTVSGITLK